MQAIRQCVPCHSPSVLLSSSSQNSETIHLGPETLRRCRDCRLTFAPLYVDPSEIYVEGYHSGGCGEFGVDISHPAWKDLLDYVGERRLDVLEKRVKPPGRFLDVGCGIGNTLVAARRRGWETTGVELVPSAVQIAVDEYGLNVKNSTLEESGLPKRSFDVVAANHVLEHQPDGAAFLASIGEWVRPGGHLFIEVPNWNSCDRRWNHEAWIGLRPLEHLAHYSPRTLARTMRRLGFTPKLVRTPFYRTASQSLGQILHDHGLDRLQPYLARSILTVPLMQRDQSLRGPNAFLGHILKTVDVIESKARSGVVVVMVAQVP